MAQWKLISGYIYVVLFEVFGFVYAVGMTFVVVFQSNLFGLSDSAIGFVDKMFTFLFLAQVVIGFCIHNDYPDLKFRITLDREEDGQNVPVKTKHFNFVFFSC